MREIDKDLAKFRIGIVLITPSFLITIVYYTTYEDLRDASLLLGPKSGLSTVEDSM